MKIVRLGIDSSGCWMAFDVGREVDALLDHIKELIPEIATGDGLTMYVDEISEEEFAKMPEFEGW